MNTYLICDSSHWRSVRRAALLRFVTETRRNHCSYVETVALYCMVSWRRQSYPTWCDNILSLESKRRLSIRSNKWTLTNCTSVKPRDELNDTALLVRQCFDLFLPSSKQKLQQTLGHEIRKNFSMAIFQNSKIFFHFHVYYCVA